MQPPTTALIPFGRNANGLSRARRSWFQPPGWWPQSPLMSPFPHLACRRPPSAWPLAGRRCPNQRACGSRLPATCPRFRRKPPRRIRNKTASGNKRTRSASAPEFAAAQTLGGKARAETEKLRPAELQPELAQNWPISPQQPPPAKLSSSAAARQTGDAALPGHWFLRRLLREQCLLAPWLFPVLSNVILRALVFFRPYFTFQPPHRSRAMP